MRQSDPRYGFIEAIRSMVQDHYESIRTMVKEHYETIRSKVKDN